MNSIKSDHNIFPKVSSFNDLVAPDIHHFQVDLSSGATGFGTDFSEEKALLKAFSEATERHVFKRNRKELGSRTSSGFAAHTDLAQSMAKATAELIERDAFFLSWIAGHSPVWFDPETLSLGLRNQIIQIENVGIRTKVGLVAKSQSHFVAIGVLLGTDQHRFGSVFSTSSDSSIDGAVQGTLFELRRAANMILNSRNEFKSKTDSPDDGASTLNYYLDPLNQAGLLSYLAGGSHLLQLEEFDVTCTTIDHGLAELPWSIHVSLAASPQCQQLVFGPIDQSAINKSRFARNGLTPVNFLASPLP